MPKRQFVLRLDPEDPADDRLIERLEQARKTAWGGVQQMLKAALLQYAEEGERPQSPAIAPTPRQEETTTPAPAALLDAIRQVNPGIAPYAAQALANSEPLRAARALYTAFAAFDPETITEIEVLLLRELQARIEDLLHTAAEQRQPIRRILNQE